MVAASVTLDSKRARGQDPLLPAEERTSFTCGVKRADTRSAHSLL